MLQAMLLTQNPLLVIKAKATMLPRIEYQPEQIR